MAGKVKETLLTLLKKIAGFVMGLIRKATNWAKLKFSKTHLNTYMEYLKNKDKFNWDAKIKAGKKLNSNAFNEISSLVKDTNFSAHFAKQGQSDQPKDKVVYDENLYNDPNETIKKMVIKIDGEITIKEALNGENNIKFISKEFFKSIEESLGIMKKCVKEGEELAKKIKKEDMGENPSGDEKKSANIQYKNQVNYIKRMANNLNSFVSAAITVSGFVNSCVKKGLGKASEEKPKEEKKEEKPTTEEKK